MAIGSPGIGSGLDINGLVAGLVAAERTPTATRLGVKEARIQAEISAFGSLKSALSSFQSSLSGLKNLTTFQQTSASSGDADIFKVTSDATAVPGTFQIEVERLASFHKVISQGFADPTAAVGSGTLNIDVGGDAFSIALDGSESLEDIRDAINGASDNTGVGATIIAVDDGFGGTVSKLALTATESGSDGVITMTVNDGDDASDVDDAGLSRLVFAANVGDTATLDAQLRVDGELITSSSNKVTGAITGLTIELISATDPAEDTTNPLTISVNTGAVEKSINAFVKSYNSLIGVFNKLANFNPETGEGSILLGDSTLRRVRDQISREIGGAVATATGGIDALGQLGIKSTDDGTLEIDSAKLSAAIGDSFSDIGALFASDDGVAVKLDAIIENYVGSDGFIDTRTNGLDGSLEIIKDQLLRLDIRSANLEARLLKQFTALDSLIAQLSSTGNFLAQQLAALPAPLSINKD